MFNLNDSIFYKPVTFSYLVESALSLVICFMIVSLISEKTTKIITKLQFFVYPIVVLFFYILQKLNVFNIEAISLNFIIVLITSLFFIILIEKKFNKK
jgi:hypothetical protein